MSDTITAHQNPRRMLAAYDRFIGGLDMTDEETAIAIAVARAACFGEAAYEAGHDRDQGTHAMARAFLCAMIDPVHPDLDYLRADPASGEAMRAAVIDKTPAMTDPDAEEPLGHCETCGKSIMPGDKATFGGPDSLWLCEDHSATLQDNITWYHELLANGSWAEDWLNFESEDEVRGLLAQAEAEIAATGNRTMAVVCNG